MIQGSFGGNSLLCYRGIKPTDHVFIDKKELHDFISLNEDGKKIFNPVSYCVQKSKILDCLAVVWGLDEEFTGEYMEDHKHVCNELSDFKTIYTPAHSTPQILT